MTRTIVDLDARATVLDAAERLASLNGEGDIALVVAAGAPLLRSGVFLDVLRSQLGTRRLSLVTPDARARSVAASVHVPAYASLAALERRELDPTERLDRARRTAIATARPATVSAPRPPLGRVAAIAGSLAAAALLLAAVIVPEARVYVAATTDPIAPAEFVIRGTTGGSADLTVERITQPISAKIVGIATGTRVEESRSRGTVELSNKTTDDVKVPKGTIFRTTDGFQFLSLADATVPRSVIIPPFDLFIGKVKVGVEAAVAGTGSNVAANRITIGPDPSRYGVTNPEPTTGGDQKRIPVVRAEDYDAAVKSAPEALKAAGDDQLQRWTREPRPGKQVVPQVMVRQDSVSPSSADVVGREVERFELTVSGVATAYVSLDSEPKRAITAKLQDVVERGNDVASGSVLYDVKTLKIADDGVTWTVTARGEQIKRVDTSALARALAGKALRDHVQTLEAAGVRWLRTEWAPSWWPLLPLLDSRITVRVEP